MFKRMMPLFLLAAIMLSACGGSQPPAPTIDTNAAFTQAAETVIAELTMNAPGTGTTPTPDANQVPTITQAPIQPATLTPAPSNTPEPTQTPEVSATFPLPATATLVGSPADQYTLQFEDDFSRTLYWAEILDDDWGFGYSDDRYYIYDDLSFATIWSIRNDSFSDVRLEVDIYPSEGPNDGYGGVVCRHVNEDSYYAFLVNFMGEWGIGKMEGGEWEFLAEGQATADLLKPAGEGNRVRADCADETLSLYINNHLLSQVDEDDFAQGAVGMAVRTNNTSGVEVLFDNYEIYTP